MPKLRNSAGHCQTQDPSTSPNLKPCRETIRQAVDLLAPDDVVELRARLNGRWVGGTYDDPEQLSRDAYTLSARGADGVYWLPNPLSLEATNTCKPLGRGEAARNDDVLRRHLLFIDIDPVRPRTELPSGDTVASSATDEEKEDAFQRAQAISVHLRKRGFPEPLLVDSGNGYHVLYRIDLPPRTPLVRDLLRLLDERFSDDVVKVDTAVHNAARLQKLPGTVARKGPQTASRPHRISRILDAPSSGLEVVPESTIIALFGVPASQPQGSIGLSEVEEARIVLSYIDWRPEYIDWLKIAWAVVDKVGDVDVAIRLLIEWRAEEKAGEYEKKLKCDRPLDRITFGTAVYYAKKGGYDPREHLSRNGRAEDVGDQDWPDPILLREAHRPPPIPTDALPHWLSAHVRSVADNLQVPVVLPLLLALSALAAALQKKVEVVIRLGWIEPLILWTVGILPSGERKSPTFKKMMGPVFEYERAERAHIEPERLRALDEHEILEKRLEHAKKQAVKATTEEDRHKAQADVEAAREELEGHYVPPLPKLWVDDVTPERLLQLMQENGGRMLISSPEGDLFKYMGGRYSQTAYLDVFKKSWTGYEALRDDRVTRKGSDVPNPSLSMGACAQPHVFESLAEKATFRGEGILARILYGVGRSRVGYRMTGDDVPEIDVKAQRRSNRNIKRLLDFEPAGYADGDLVAHTLHLSDEAEQVRAVFETEIERMLRPGGRLEHLKDWGCKLVGQSVRIAGLLHMATHMDKGCKRPISGETMVRAVELARALIPHALAAFDLMDADPRIQVAQYIWGRIQAIAEPTCTVRDLWQATKSKSSVRSVDDLRAPLHLLKSHHLIRVETRKSAGPGRPPSPLICINPKVFSFYDSDERSTPGDDHAGADEVSASHSGSDPATREDFLATWGPARGALGWSYWMEWGQPLVKDGTLDREEALYLRNSIEEGPTGEHAEATIERLLDLAPGDVRSRYDQLSHRTPTNGQPDATSVDGSAAPVPRSGTAAPTTDQ